MIKNRDFVTAYELQQLPDNSAVMGHSRGVRDINNAMVINAYLGLETPLYVLAVGSPIAQKELETTTNAVGAKLVRQVNHPFDPVGALSSKEASLNYGIHLATSFASEYFAPRQIMSSKATKNAIGYVGSSVVSAGAGITGITGIISKGLGVAGVVAYPLWIMYRDLDKYHPFKTYYENPDFQIKETIQNIFIQDALKRINERRFIYERE